MELIRAEATLPPTQTSVSVNWRYFTPGVWYRVMVGRCASSPSNFVDFTVTWSIATPLPEERVENTDFLLRWQAVPGATGYIITADRGQDAVNSRVVPSVDNAPIPKGWLQPGYPGAFNRFL